MKRDFHLLLSNMLVMPMSMMSRIKCSVSRSDHMYRFFTSVTDDDDDDDLPLIRW